MVDEEDWFSATSVATEVATARKSEGHRWCASDSKSLARFPGTLGMNELPAALDDTVIIDALRVEAELRKRLKPALDGPLRRSRCRRGRDEESQSSTTKRRRSTRDVDTDIQNYLNSSFEERGVESGVNIDLDIENYLNSSYEEERGVETGVNIVDKAITRPACAARGLGPNDHGGLTFKKTRDIVRGGIRGQTKLQWRS